MRKIILASSFDAEFISIYLYIEDRFWIVAADEFEDRFRSIALNIAELPMIGTREHGYSTNLYGFILFPNWIFYRFTDEEITFLHIRSGYMLKQSQTFTE